MDTDAKGQLGGMDAGEELRRRYAKQSAVHRCAACAKTNAEIMAEQDQAVQAAGDEQGDKRELLPPELRLAYREDLKAPQNPKDDTAAHTVPSSSTTSALATTSASRPVIQAPSTRIVAPAARQTRALEADLPPAWIDKSIFAVVIALIALFWYRYLD